MIFQRYWKTMVWLVFFCISCDFFIFQFYEFLLKIHRAVSRERDCVVEWSRVAGKQNQTLPTLGHNNPNVNGNEYKKTRAKNMLLPLLMLLLLRSSWLCCAVAAAVSARKSDFCKSQSYDKYTRKVNDNYIANDNDKLLLLFLIMKLVFVCCSSVRVYLKKSKIFLLNFIRKRK